MQKNKSVLFITETAMMIALSVIIGIFCKNFLNFGAGLFPVGAVCQSGAGSEVESRRGHGGRPPCF